MSSILPEVLESRDPLPEVVQGYVAYRSQGGTSAYDALPEGADMPESAEPFRAASEDRREAIKAIDASGLTLIAESRLGAAVAGPPEAYEELTGGRLVTRERLVYASGEGRRYVTHVDLVGEEQPAALGAARCRSKAARIEAVLLERPALYHQAFVSPFPPAVGTFHLRVPDDVAVGLGAVRLHREGQIGAGVRVAMVDSGQGFHPFFATHHYTVRPAVAIVPGTDPSVDPDGHGTGESANIFALAPGAELQPFRASNSEGKLVGAIGGFLAAKDTSPAVLTNSWGGDGPFPPPGQPDSFEISWALEILDAIDQGIFVVFSGGNGHFSIEPQVPGVLAAGGAYLDTSAEIKASDYTSGYPSPWFSGVVVPDVCGLVGLSPRAKYILLPIPAGARIDRDLSAPAPPFDPEGDGTSAGDGWALFSGSSAAAPQIAGLAALILGARPGLTPAQVTEAIKATALDVTRGRCHPRFDFAAEPGHDRATGHGLANADAAVRYALDRF